MGIVGSIKHWFARRHVREGVNDELMAHAEAATQNLEIEVTRLREIVQYDHDPIEQFMTDLRGSRHG